MGIRAIYKGIGKGSIFGHGRIFFHNPLDTDINKAKDEHINVERTLLRLSKSNDIKIQNAVVDNISDRLRSPCSKAHIEHIFNSFDRKIIAKALSSEIFKHQWLQEPILQFIAQAPRNKELSSDIYRKALIRLTSYPSSVRPKIANDAYNSLYPNITSAEFEQIAQIGPSSDVAEHMMSSHKTPRNILLLLANSDYGNERINLKVYSILKQNLSRDDLDILSQSKSKHILKNVCKNPKSSPNAVANAVSGLIEKNGNEYDINSVDEMCLLIEARPNKHAVLYELNKINYELTANMIVHLYIDHMK